MANNLNLGYSKNKQKILLLSFPDFRISRNKRFFSKFCSFEKDLKSIFSKFSFDEKCFIMQNAL